VFLVNVGLDAASVSVYYLFPAAGRGAAAEIGNIGEEEDDKMAMTPRSRC
jgi:hypothetical protein